MRTLPLVLNDLVTPLRCAYTVSDSGVVINVTTGVTVKGTAITKLNRYRKVHLDKFRPVHRIVALHFVPNQFPDTHTQVNHKDGDRLNNSASNLEWVTPSQNVLHAYATALKSNAGTNNPVSILTEQDVKAIRASDPRMTARQVRDSLNLRVGVSTVKKVRSGKNWKHVGV